MSACRLCGAPLEHVVADLGVSPVANDFVREEDLGRMEPFYPLCALVCARCLLVQLEAFEPPEQIFSDDYAYFSSYSTGWLEHARRYTERWSSASGSTRRARSSRSHRTTATSCSTSSSAASPCSGVEPTANTAAVAIAKGIPTEIRFFGLDTAAELRAEHAADLLIANNVLAHVPDLNDFVAGLAALLAPEGVLTIEFPHLLRLLEEAQFDTIYHEHFSYFSLLTVDARARAPRPRDLRRRGAPDARRLAADLRRHTSRASPASAWLELRERERAAGLEELATYLAFADRVRREKREIVRFFIEQKEAGVSIAGYGAPAKGNTLLNYCGIGRDFIDYTVDLNPHKQGRYLPGTRIPVRDPDEIRRTQPDLVFILPWNLRDEVMEQLAFVRDWGGRFAARSPEHPDLPVITPSNGRPSTQPIWRAGTPATIAPSATERVTTALAPTTAFLPMVTPFSTTTFWAIHTKSPISTGSATSGCRARCRSGAMPWSWSRIATFEPIRTLLPIVTDSAAATLKYPSICTSSPMRTRPGLRIGVGSHRLRGAHARGPRRCGRSRCGRARSAHRAAA